MSNENDLNGWQGEVLDERAAEEATAVLCYSSGTVSSCGQCGRAIRSEAHLTDRNEIIYNRLACRKVCFSPPRTSMLSATQVDVVTTPLS